VTLTPPNPARPAGSDKRLADKTLKHKELRLDKLMAWLLAAVLLAGVVSVWAVSRYAGDIPAHARRVGGDTPVGYLLGAVSVALYALAAAYSWRHRHRVQKRVMTRTWMEIHLSFGLVAGVSALLHSGPRLGAPLHGGLLIAWLFLIVSGLVGKLVSVVVPRRLTRIEDEALLVEDVVERQKAIRTEIEQLLRDVDDGLLRLVNRDIPKKIRSPDHYGARRMRRAQVASEVYALVDGDALLAKQVISPDRKDWLQRLIVCLVEERFLDRMLTYHYLLRAWLPIHVALTSLCLPWLLFHIVAVFLF
jgi:hypothetical protein